MTHHSIFPLALIASLSACGPAKAPEIPASTAGTPSGGTTQAEVPPTPSAASPDTPVSSLTHGADTPVAPGTAPATQCTPKQFVAADACFDQAARACASLSCQHGCDILELAPSKVICSANANSSSGLTRCGGIANWQCPEIHHCAPDPASSCKYGKGLDCIGTCTRHDRALVSPTDLW